MRAIPKFIDHLLIFLIFLCEHVGAQVSSDFAELFEGGFEVLDDFLGEKIGIGEIVGFFKAFIADPEDIEVGFVAVMSSS